MPREVEHKLGAIFLASPDSYPWPYRVYAVGILYLGIELVPLQVRTLFHKLPNVYVCAAMAAKGPLLGTQHTKVPEQLQVTIDLLGGLSVGAGCD